MFKKLLIPLLVISIFLGVLGMLSLSMEHVGEEIQETSIPMSGFSLTPDSDVYVSRKVNGQEVYNVRYITDHHGLRLIENQHPEKSEEHLILGGCSFLFGQGLPVEESLPYLLEAANSKYHTYSLADMGGGLNTSLYRLQNNQLDIKEQTGKMIYVHIFAHAHRWFAKGEYLSWASPAAPYYLVQNENVVSSKIENAMGYNLFQWLSDKGFNRTSAKLANIFRPTSFSDEELKDFVKAVKFTRKIYQDKFPKGEFIFLFHPMDVPPESARLAKFLTEAGIKNIHPTEEFYNKAKDVGLSYHTLIIPHDGHPNAKANKIFAKLLNDSIL